MKVEDEDGIDGPFERAMARAMRDDAMKMPLRKATSRKKAYEVGVGITSAALRAVIDRDGRSDTEISRLNPILPVGKVKQIFRAALAEVESKRPFDPKYVERRDGRRGMVANMDLLTASNILREFGLP